MFQVLWNKFEYYFNYVFLDDFRLNFTAYVSEWSHDQISTVLNEVMKASRIQNQTLYFSNNLVLRVVFLREYVASCFQK